MSNTLDSPSVNFACHIVGGRLADSSHPSELPFRRRRNRRQLAAGLGRLSRRLAEGRRLSRRPLHRRDDQRPVRRCSCARSWPRRQPDVVGATAITPSIYKAERALQIAKEAAPERRHHPRRHPRHLHVSAGADRGAVDRRDRARRGRGDPRSNLMRAIEAGDWPADAHEHQGHRLSRRGRRPRSSRPRRRRRSRTSTRSIPTGASWNGSKYNYIPMNCRVAIPNMARGCPFTCSFCSQWKFWRDYRVRDPKKVVDEIETLYQRLRRRFFILADEEPTINRKKFVQFCEELIARGLPEQVQWGINTRVTDILRDEELLPLYRKAGPDPRLARHRGGGAVEARPLQQGDQGRRQQAGDPAAARGRHRRRGAVHRRPGERDRGDAGGNLPDGDGLEARPRQLVDVHAVAVHRSCSRR